MSLIDDARAMLESGPVCDSCLGRPVADRSFGLTDAERGRALRTTVALTDVGQPEAPVGDGAAETRIADRSRRHHRAGVVDEAHCRSSGLPR